VAGKKFRHKHKAHTQGSLLFRCFLPASYAAGEYAFFFSLFSFQKKIFEQTESNFMMLPQIRCYHPDGLLLPNVFFILSKGPNAGQPSFQPWANCFQVVCPNEKYFDFYFWLCYGLFKAGKFKFYHRGSVINFINKPDIQKLLKDTATEIFPHWEKYLQIMQACNKLEQRKTSLAEQILTTDKLQATLISSCFAK
jgi:hypothetical protein